MKITNVRLRGILDSRACVTVEADLMTASGHGGTGSAPKAIAPGRLERRRGPLVRLGPVELPELTQRLTAAGELDQQGCDALLTSAYAEGLAGAEVTLAVSLAFARATAAASGRPLHLSLAEQAGTTPAIPRLMINVFSGGIHDNRPPDRFQQVMLLPATGALIADIELAVTVFAAAERQAIRRFGSAVLSASSGLIVPAGGVQVLDLLAEVLDATVDPDRCAIGVDVAAEHLLTESGLYRFDGGEWKPEMFQELIAVLAQRYRINYVEDPFDAEHVQQWQRLRVALPDAATLVGDDLFATDPERVDRSLADGILLKPSQSGTVTGTLAAAVAAWGAGMRLAVSHRSGETEDTAMCDLAVAIGAELIKVGGPRRGDRLAKYNQLLRLAEGTPACSASPHQETGEGK